MKSFIEMERGCALVFSELGTCWHLWTPENFEIIFTCEDDFKSGMTLMGISSKLFPEVRILTFELMSNHIHITAAGVKETVEELFATYRQLLERYTKHQCRTIDWRGFNARTRQLTDLGDLRNVIVYDNRNGYLVSPDHTPFSYPWGANKYFFNPDAKTLAESQFRLMTTRERRQITHSHIADAIPDLRLFDGICLPTCFCDIDSAEKLFRNASQYFHLVGKSLEADLKIAEEISESICYTDDELFAIACRMCREKYECGIPSQIPAKAKLELASVLCRDYHASPKFLTRVLKLDAHTLNSIFKSR